MRCASIIISLIAAGVFAAQEVIVDQELDYQLTTGRVNVNISGKTLNWTNGYTYRRVEVLTKPTDFGAGIQMCIWSGGECCSPCVPFSETGVFYLKTEPKAWWGDAGSLSWNAHGTRGYCLKNAQCGGKWISTKNVHYCMGPSAAEHLPILVHMTEIYVPYDGEFECPSDWLDPESPFDECMKTSVKSPSQSRLGTSEKLSVYFAEGDRIRVTAPGADRVLLFTIDGRRVRSFACTAHGQCEIGSGLVSGSPAIITARGDERGQRSRILYAP